MKKLLRNLLIGSMVLAGATTAFASTIPNTPALYESYLANTMGTSDTTMTLASGALRDGTSLSGFNCFTIDANTPILEYVCGTVSGVNVTGLMRGLDAVSGTTTIASLQFSHRRGADVKITEYPVLAILARIFQNIDTIAVPLTYGPGVATTTLASNRQNIADWGLVQDTALTGSGAIAATTLAKGYVQLATGAQASASTALGSSGASLALTTSISTSTRNFGTNVNVVPVTNASGKVDPNFIFNATTTWPNNNGGTASSTLLENDGNGNLSWNPMHSYTLYSTTASVSTALTSTTTLLTVPIPANTINGTNQVLRVRSYWASDGNALCYYGLDFGNGTASTTVGFASAFYSTLLASDMVATTTSAESWSSDGTMMGYNTTGKPQLVTTVGNSEWTMNAFPTTSLLAKTYLAFNAVTVTASSCKLNGVTVEVVGQ